MVGTCELNHEVEVEDRIVWIHDKGAVFSVKKLSQLLAYDGIEAVEFSFDRIWSLKVPPKVRNFLWMLAINRIPTKDFLISRRIQIDSSNRGCPWCDRVLENTNHLFFECSFIKSFWSFIFSWWDLVWKDVTNIDELCSVCWSMKLTGIQKSLWLLVIAASCWTLWLA
ncbi:hypothetical protein PVK06_036644 [Gossypium arboreum]|uniref:Reverse transcriptase zinc-binding domain-containing protein n=1 Tax=Gossypium arboreum TaxID=29729 RepID=A0ABR0NK32_GOSAR|nr:hypothetical protein PVK06_036644 [Gossypium arboreum]